MSLHKVVHLIQSEKRYMYPWSSIDIHMLGPMPLTNMEIAAPLSSILYTLDYMLSYKFSYTLP